MNLKDRSQEAVEAAGKVFGTALSKDQQAALSQVIEAAMVDAMRETAQQSGEAALACCSHDKDMAHKIADEIERSHQALIANLSSLR